MKATLGNASNSVATSQRRLISREEARRLALRKAAGRVFAVITFIPMLLSVLLVITLLVDTYFDTISWQIVEPSSSTSGKSFAWSEAPLGGDKVLRLDIKAQDEDPEDIQQLLNDPEEFNDFKARSRVELMWLTQDGPWRWVVTNKRDDLNGDIGLFGVNAYLQKYRDDLREEDKSGLEPEQVALLKSLNEANLEGGLTRSFANIGLLKKTLGEDERLYLNPWLDFSFLTRTSSSEPQSSGLKIALLGTLWIMALVLLISVPIGVGAAIYLEEYAPKNRWSRLLEINIRNLAGVPSIVYGILGLYLFVRMMSLGKSIIAAALTLSLLILPVVIIAAREAIRAVPGSLRQASYGLGASKWQTVSQVVLPNAVSGIVTGVILAVARAIGETAPLLLVGAVGFIAFAPTGLGSSYTVIPAQIYNWISQQKQEFYHVASAGIFVLLFILTLIYAAAFYLRRRFERSW